jgi:TonB-linked SusC/RagA family outer membrane protein
MKILYQKPGLLFIVILLFCPVWLFGQTKIKGTVTDKTGGLPGVTVTNVTRNLTTSTDQLGNFTIEAASTDVLSFKSVGYLTQQATIKGNESPVILMTEDQRSLNEVVIVGYGKQNKSEVSGAISTVKSEAIINRPVTNVLAALQGTAPGLVVTRTNGQPGKEGYGAQIRGFSSVNGSSPLILVDGVEQASIGSLDQNEIESITILKDASAAAIYGARGANGVILITSKKGVQGKLTIAANSQFSVNHAHNIPERLHSYEEASMLNESRVNAGNAPAFTPEMIEWMKNGPHYRVNPADPSSYEYFYDVDMIDSVMRPNRNTLQHQHNISASGGDVKSQYLLSFGYLGQNGIFKFGPDKNQRYNGRFNYNTKFTEWLSLDSRIAYSDANVLSPAVSVGGDYGLLYNIYELRSLYPVHLPGTNFYTSGASSNQTYAQLQDGGETKERTNNANGVFTLQAGNFVKGLSIKAIYAPYLQVYNYNNSKRRIAQYNLNGVAAYWNNPNSYTVTKSNVYRANYQFLTDYDFNLGEKNSFHVLGGYQIETFRSASSTAIAKNLSSNDLFSLNLGDPSQYSASDNIDTWATQSYFGRLNYNYDERYYIEGVVRVDGSSKLAPGYRYNTFPSVSASWRLSKETWFNKALPLFNEFKIRASYGQLGNSDLSNFGSYDYLATLAKSGAYPFNNTATYGYYNNTLPSPQKTWEIINTSNAGIDLVLFNNRLNLSGDYFIRKNKNMLVQVNTTSMIGINTAQYNAASMKSWGWEISFGWRDKIGKEFSYWMNGNVADNKNKVLSYQGQSVVASGLNSVIEGEELNTIWGYQADGLFSSKEQAAQHAFQSNITDAGDIIYRDQNGDNKIDGGRNTIENHGDLVKLGSTTPRYTFGFSLGGSVKGIDFSAFFQGVGKRNMLINSYYTVPFVESWRQPIQGQTDYWTPTNMDARFPRLYIGGGQNLSPSSWWIQNASYIRLKNVQIGYTLPASVAKKAHLSKVRIFFTGQDLWEKSGMWLNFYDAEEPNNSTLNYPLFRSYALGLNITL